MFSQWVAQLAKRFIAGLQPKLRFSSPLRLIADLLFALFIFLTLNRRPLATYGRSFWIQLAYLAQLLKVTYTLRFILVEIVFREMRTFFCLINPYMQRWAPVLKKWEGSSALCPVKILNLVFSGIFIFLNVAIVLGIESLSKKLWTYYWTGKFPTDTIRFSGVPPPPVVYPTTSSRRRRQRSGLRYKMRHRRRSSHSAGCQRAPCRRREWGIKGRVIWRNPNNSDSDASVHASRSTARQNRNRSANSDAYDTSPRRTRSGRYY